MLVPLPWSGVASDCEELPWIKNLKDTTWLALWQRWPTHDLPLGYDSYVVSFHLEPVHVDWLDRQCDRIDVPIIVLFDGSYYDWPHRDNLIPLCYFYWHQQADSIMRWHGKQHQIQPKTYLASAVCHRITQSKLMIFTALAEYLDPALTRLVLGTWLEEKNVHHKQPTGHAELDGLSEIFWSKYFGKEIRHDVFDESQNFQAYTSNYQVPFLTESAVHFTNESYHYSLMGEHTRPGPFITEKTLKCLVGGHAIIPVGQFDTYQTLSRLGFQFDYKFDTTWDADPGNISRLTGIVNLIKSLRFYEPDELLIATKDSTEHNLDHVNSGSFAKICENHNESTVNYVLDMLQ